MERGKPCFYSLRNYGEKTKKPGQIGSGAYASETLLNAQERTPAGHTHAVKQQVQRMLAAKSIVTPTIESMS